MELTDVAICISFGCSLAVAFYSVTARKDYWNVPSSATSTKDDDAVSRHSFVAIDCGAP